MRRPIPVKVLFDFESLHHGMLGRDVLQEQPKLGNIPLSVAKGIKWTTLDILTVHRECKIKGTICGHDAQVLIEDQERLPDRIDNRLRERTPVVVERLPIWKDQRNAWR